MKRRTFLSSTALASLGVLFTRSGFASSSERNTIKQPSSPIKKPVVVSTWIHGMDANKAAWSLLKANKSALDAVEQGVRVTESDATNRSVGLGGNPDRDGNVTLDACIMNHESECGAVACLQNIENPISVARKVMEGTPHVMIVGKGAEEFAYEKGFPKK